MIKSSNNYVELSGARIAPLIHNIRGCKVILDSDLAMLYGVKTKRLNESCARNKLRFPEDFRFQLTTAEFESLRSQIATSKSKGGRTYKPYVFTEHGALMAANLLRSKQAVAVSVNVVRAFVKMRQMVIEVEQIAKKIEKMEEKYDSQFSDVFQTLKALILPSPVPKRRIGFVVDLKGRKA